MKNFSVTTKSRRFATGICLILLIPFYLIPAPQKTARVLGVCLLAVTLLLLYDYNRRLKKSLKSISTVIENARSGKFTFRAEADGADDLGRLAASANLLAEKIQNAAHAQNLGAHQNPEIKNPENENRRQLEQALAKSELLFKHLWDISVDGMRLMNSAGTIITVNQAYCKIVDLPGDQLEGQPFAVVYHDDDKENALEGYWQALENNTLKSHFEAQRCLWNRKNVWLEFSNSFLELPGSGKLVLSVVKDITLRKIAELELARSEKQFRLLFNSANDTIFVNRLGDDHKMANFIEVNRVACEQLLYSREEFNSLNPYALIPEKYYTILNSALQELQTNNQTIFEIEYLRKDKRRIPVEISSQLFEFKNKPAILSIARDITERKQVEQQLRESGVQLRNLASRIQNIREEERTMIAREIHDELGQVLTVLKIEISLLAKKISGGKQPFTDKFESISDLIDQTVESVQRISSKLRPGILDELGLVAAIEWQTREFEERTGTTCKCSLPLDSLTLDQELSTAIFRIFQEALTNVARHAQAARVSIFLKKEPSGIILEVTDNGLGITRSQINAPRSLGLLGMKERASIFGGRVSINGVPGKGTHVKVEMPIKENS